MSTLEWDLPPVNTVHISRDLPGPIWPAHPDHCRCPYCK